MTTQRRPRRSSPFNVESPFKLFGKSKKLIQKYIWIFGPLYFISLIFSFHAWAWTPAIGSDNGHWWTTYSWVGSGFSSTTVPTFLWYGFAGFSLIWFVFVVAAGIAAQIMSQKAQLEVSEGKSPSFDKLWVTFKELGWRMTGLYLVMALYITVGFILLIIPGLIMLRRYFLAPYVMLEQKCSIKEAMERSAAMSHPVPKAIWGVIGVMILIGLLNAIPYLGWMIAFAVGSFYSIAPALRYQELKTVPK